MGYKAGYGLTAVRLLDCTIFSEGDYIPFMFSVPEIRNTCLNCHWQCPYQVFLGLVWRRLGAATHAIRGFFCVVYNKLTEVDSFFSLAKKTSVPNMWRKYTY